jgi:hypothetical protein
MAELRPLEFIKKYPSTNNHYIKTKDVLFNPQNPVNPDSEPGVKDKFQITIILKTKTSFLILKIL